jgi:enhancer of polycomb-like protein
VAVADMKRRFLGLGSKEDEELLHDKERAFKRKNDSHAKYVYISSSSKLLSYAHLLYSRIGLKLCTRDGDMASLNAPDNIIQPKERVAIIKGQIEHKSQGQKKDHLWDDQVDVSCFVNLFLTPLTNG